MLKKIEPVLIFLAATTWGVAIVVLVGVYQTAHFHQAPKPTVKSLQTVSFNPDNPPVQALTGQIFSFSGGVKLQTRTATQPAQLLAPHNLLQGEELQTDSSGSASFKIADVLSGNLFSNSSINFAQTLPINVVMVQSQGQVDYKKLAKVPISIQSLHLLTQVDGEASINVNADQHLISVISRSGTATVSFADKNYDTHTFIVNSGRQFIFDDDNRKQIYRGFR